MAATIIGDAHPLSPAGVRPIVERGLDILNRCFEGRTEADRPNGIRISLIVTLFGRASNFAMVAVAAALVGVTATVRTGHAAGLALTLIEFALLASRGAIIVSFRRRMRHNAVIDPAPWLTLFGLTAVASSSLWGACCFICLAVSHDPVLYTVSVVPTIARAAAVAARASSFPRLATIQLVVTLAPILIGAPFADDLGYGVLAFRARHVHQPAHIDGRTP